MWMKNLRILLVTALVLGFYTGVAHIIPQLESDVPEELSLTELTPEALVEAGERVYMGAGGCAACHGTGTRAPNLLTDHAGQGPIGARCATREPGKECKEYLYESLVQPAAYIVPGFDNIMPDFSRQLPASQLWALVAYMESLGGEVTVTADDLPAEQAAVEAGAPAPGGPPMTATLDPRELLQEKGCLGCHAIDGAGPPIGPSFDGVGRRRTLDQMRRKILDPNADTTSGFEQFAGAMPATYGQQLSAAQLEAIVRFLGERR